MKGTIKRCVCCGQDYEGKKCPCCQSEEHQPYLFNPIGQLQLFGAPPSLIGGPFLCFYFF